MISGGIVDSYFCRVISLREVGERNQSGVGFAIRVGHRNSMGTGRIIATVNHEPERRGECIGGISERHIVGDADAEFGIGLIKREMLYDRGIIVAVAGSVVGGSCINSGEQSSPAILTEGS